MPHPLAFVAGVAAARLGRRSRLAIAVLRVPRLLGWPPVRSLLYRRFSWPIAKRLRTHADVSVHGGSRVEVYTDDALGRVLAISGVWEPNVTAAFRRLLGPGDVCLDVGAHIGYFTLLASRLVGPDGHVYAFEPSPRNYRALCANLARNGVENVTALQLAAGSSGGTAVLHEGPGTNTGRATLNPITAELGRQRDQVVVEVTPVLARVATDELARVRVVKIDVEGSEIDVLRSLAALLELGRTLAVFFEFTPRWADAADAPFIESLRDEHGLELYVVPGGYTLQGLFPSRVQEPVRIDAVPQHQCDLLLLRRSSAER